MPLNSVKNKDFLQEKYNTVLIELRWHATKCIAVGDLMFLGMQDFYFVRL